jgi:hypothetical protein
VRGVTWSHPGNGTGAVEFSFHIHEVYKVIAYPFAPSIVGLIQEASI